MHPTPDRHPDGPSITSDEDLGALVRTAVDDWTMPPQRLDQPTWRDRVGGRSSRVGRGWASRVGGAAVAAVAVTVVAALAAVWLTAPSPRSGAAAAPSASLDATSDPTATSVPSTAAASPLPTLVVDGEMPEPSRLMVRNNGWFQIADLSTGRLGPNVTSKVDGPTTLFPRPGGGWLCVCGDWTAFSGSVPAGVIVNLQTANAAGTYDPPILLREIHGTEDPAFGSADSELADVSATTSPDGRHAFVAWVVQNGAAGWSGGIDVVDVATAEVVSSTSLAFTEPEGAGGSPTTRIAPRVSVSPSGDVVLVSSLWWARNGLAYPPSGIEYSSAPFDGRTIGTLTPAGSSSRDRCDPTGFGLIDDASIYVVCWSPGGGTVLERSRIDGSLIDSTPIPGMTVTIDAASNIARRGDLLYLWDAHTTTLSRFDLTTTHVDSATGVALAPAADPVDVLAALGRDIGRWIAPSALAKVFLDPGMVVSPDGTRVYALGVEGMGGDASAASLGVFVFDARTLANLGRWEPTADFVSLAIDADGRYVYAAGQPGRDASGAQISTGASITVFDTRDGAVRLIAGQLDHGFLTFPSEILQ